MSITLFKHNDDAYRTVKVMLKSVGKAAVIHPTGTGKSFIAFKLCEDNPEKRICWLAPSEYIFKTQIENLKKTTDGYAPENIQFLTYAKLMLMSETEMRGIRTDCIILDEFHRCGAEMWGKGVERLLRLYPDVPLLGLSATAVRYLDNQRNMAEELFDGNIASEMTLGDAIVRGILNPPKYVQTVFSYQNDLEIYERRVRHTKNKIVRDAAEKYLDALRRALEMADGLDKVFAKHIADRNGKYIIFCSDAEHMREMISCSAEWFGLVDKEPHIYSVYSNDPETSREFAEFKADKSDHLKLLYCIDMLNEGIHIDDVAGVILFRPTVSPIVYKQQIGRALAAGNNSIPVIFDIVNNIENLYSIGTIEEEMRVAITYYRDFGDLGEIVNDRFTVIDEVKECRELFERLNDTLSASWDMMFSLACSFYEEHGHLNVPKTYKTEDGYSLGSWVLTQRNVRSGKQYGLLSEERIKKLDTIGMVWDSVRDFKWNRYFEAAESYYNEHGDLNTDVSYKTENGLALGKWICQLRTYRKSGIQAAYLTDERVKALDSIGMIWSVPDYLWESGFASALEYYREYGHLDIPYDYVTINGQKLGVWIANQRSRRRNPDKYAGSELTSAQIDRLNEIGMIWDKKSDSRWEEAFAEAKKYYLAHGDLNVPVSYISEKGHRLGRWISRQRSDGYKKLSEERKARLDSIGMVWKDKDPWMTKYSLVKKYYDENGNVNIPWDYITEGIWLNKWLNEQKHIYMGKRNGKKLSSEQIKLLRNIGVHLEPAEGFTSGIDCMNVSSVQVTI